MIHVKRLAVALVVLSCPPAIAQDALQDRARSVAARLVEIEKLGGDHLGYAREGLRILREGLRVSLDDASAGQDRIRWRRRGPTQIDPLSLLAGGLAIRESLQLDRLDAFRPGQGSVAIENLKPPATPSHPFDKMLEGRTWSASELAKAVPEDFYYAIFHSMERCLDFADYLDEVGGLVIRRYAPESVDFRVKTKLLTQLAIRVTPEARKFYDAVIDELVIAGSDPFLREGSDLTLIYKLKSPRIFRMSIGLYRKYFELTYGATVEEATIGGRKASGLVTPDRTVHSWMLSLADDVVVISNSSTALERVTAVWKGESPSLHAAADFRYMRSIYPADPEVEDGFLYLSDASIRRMVGPELRIGEARRLAEAARMAALERHVILYHQLHDRFPESVDAIFADFRRNDLSPELRQAVKRLLSSPVWRTVTELRQEQGWAAFGLNDWRTFDSQVASRMVRAGRDQFDPKRWERDLNTTRRFAAELKQVYASVHGRPPRTPSDAFALMEGRFGSDAAARFADLELIAGRFSVRSRTHGRMGFFTPNLETPVRVVSPAEAEGYRQFVREYESYWRTYFDPIGLRLRRGGGRRIEVCILPLINNSIYDMVRFVFGGRPVPITVQPLPDEVFSLGLKVGKDAPPLRELPFLEKAQRELAKELDLPDLDLVGLLGDSLEIHARDAEPLMDFDASGLLREILPRGGRARDLEAGSIVLLAYSAFHPLRVALGIRDEARAEALLTRLDAALMAEKVKLEAQRGAGFLDFGLDHYRFAYRGTPVRVVKIALIGALHFRIFYAIHGGRLHLTTTESYIKDVIDAGANEAKREVVEGNVFLVLRPARMRRERAVFERTAMEAALNASLKNFGTVRLMATLFPGEEDLAGRCYRAFGFEPVSPAGGRYAVDPATRTVTDSAFGTRGAPQLDAEALRKATGMNRFFSTERIRIVLRFTPEGIMTSVEVL